MFGFIRKMFVGLLSACAIRSFGESLASNSKGHIRCVYQLYIYTLSINKCAGSCNAVDDSYTRLFGPDESIQSNMKYQIWM